MMFESLTKDPTVPVIRKLIPSIVLILFAGVLLTQGQGTDNRGKNNPYSPSPSGRSVQVSSVAVQKPVTNEFAPATRNQSTLANVSTPPVTIRNVETSKPAETRPATPSEIYKIGIGDVLFIDLTNSSQGAGYYTVRANGTIDFPLAGGDIIVTGQTVDKIDQMLRSRVTLFPNPKFEVKVREYASHKITVFGMVTNAGEKSLRREAIPLFVIRADAGVDSKATRVVIKRGQQSTVESHDLREADTDNTLIYPGDSVEFASGFGSQAANGSFYFISGQIASSGQKEMTAGLTLYQAIVASGGLKGDPKNAIVRRKAENGRLSLMEHDLRKIKKGKAPDPVLTPGDVIEIRK